MERNFSPYFKTEIDALKFVEEIRWGGKPVCPHCGYETRIYDLSNTRVGLWKCGDCRKQFTVRIGTIFEASHIPLHKWLQALVLKLFTSQGISARQLHQTLEITYKSAWHMNKRLNSALKQHCDGFDQA